MLALAQIGTPRIEGTVAQAGNGVAGNWTIFAVNRNGACAENDDRRRETREASFFVKRNEKATENRLSPSALQKPLYKQ
jgi:hypothetical protein